MATSTPKKATAPYVVVFVGNVTRSALRRAEPGLIPPHAELILATSPGFQMARVDFTGDDTCPKLETDCGKCWRCYGIQFRAARTEVAQNLADKINDETNVPGATLIMVFSAGYGTYNREAKAYPEVAGVDVWDDLAEVATRVIRQG